MDQLKDSPINFQGKHGSKKIVLGFSGGLDTSFCVTYFKENGAEVHSIIVNTGGFTEE
ncbi:MAG: argininosuccinate synthase domain-containing protein, partial [Flavisolibacter sp.]